MSDPDAPLHDVWDALIEQAHEMRQAALRGIVASSSDTGQAQTVDVTSHDGMTRSGVEVMQVYGFASRPAAAGAVAIVLAIGGDPGDLVALPICNPAQRFGGLAEGETVIYAADGTRVALRAGGRVQVLAATEVDITAADVVVTASGGVTINGDVHVVGNLTSTGDVSDAHGKLSGLRGHYDAHVHGSSPGTSQPD